MTLFTIDPKTGETPVDMNPDEVIEYLQSLEKDKVIAHKDDPN
jgi:hypothetical protein